MTERTAMTTSANDAYGKVRASEGQGGEEEYEMVNILWYFSNLDVVSCPPPRTSRPHPRSRIPVVHSQWCL